MIPMSAIPDAIRNEALSLGFDQVRFCNAQTTPGYEQYAKMIQENRHGSMEWMARSAHLRATPELLLQPHVCGGIEDPLCLALTRRPGRLDGTSIHVRMGSRLPQPYRQKATKICSLDA